MALFGRVSVLGLSGASLLILVACGGGGGTSAGAASAPPLPPATNIAPNVVVSVDESAPHEGQFFTLDASATTDANRDALTFSWVQTAGPTVDIPGAGLSALEQLRVPELTATVTATFELTVSDGRDSVVQTIDVEFTNIRQMPRYPVEFPLVQTAAFAGSAVADFRHAHWGDPTFFAFATEPGGNIAIVEMALNGISQLSSVFLNQVTEGISQPVILASTSRLSRSGRAQFYALEESRDLMSAYVKLNEDYPFERVGTFQIASPCALNEPEMGGSISVGQRNNGFSVLKHSMSGGSAQVSFNLFQKVGTDESFCAFREVNEPLGGGSFIDNDARFREDMLALDTETNTLHIFEQDENLSADTSKYRLRESVALDLETSETLTFVTSVNVSDGLAMVFTDGVHNGTHRLVFVGLDKDRKLIQQTYRWSIGAPTDILAFQMYPATYPSVMIVSETSPDAIIFVSQDIVGSEPFFLTEPVYYHIGLGATLGAVVEFAYPEPQHHLLINDREDRQVRYGQVPWR